MKALGAAAASSGSVAMFHAVGITPEAPTLDAATAGEPVPEIVVSDGTAAGRHARELGTAANGRLGAVSVGTPHASLAELERLAALLGTDESAVPFYVNVGRDVLAEAERRGSSASLESAGCSDRHRHVHLHLAGHGGRGRPGDDRLREVGLVRADEHRRRRRDRRPRGVRPVGGGGTSAARRDALGRWLRPARSSRERPRAVRSCSTSRSPSGAASIPETGDIIDVRHPQHGANVAGRILVMPSGRGSSSSSSVLAESIRAGTAPAAIVLGEADPILALGAIVARELYGKVTPVVVATDPSLPSDGCRVMATRATARSKLIDSHGRSGDVLDFISDGRGSTLDLSPSAPAVPRRSHVDVQFVEQRDEVRESSERGPVARSGAQRTGVGRTWTNGHSGCRPSRSRCRRRSVGPFARRCTSSATATSGRRACPRESRTGRPRRSARPCAGPG